MTSFEFKWDGTKKASGGKVFAKKKNTNKVVKKTNNKETPAVKNVEIQSTVRTEHREQPTETSDFQSKFVKRKQKKDKLAAQNLLKEGDESGLQNLQSASNKVSQHSLFSERNKQIYVKTNPGVSVIEKVFSADKKFSSLNIHRHLLSNLEKIDFSTLTNVQEKSIPVVLSGKNVLIRSQTGSGKTLAYAVPIVDALQGIDPRLKRTDGVQAIVVVPTRELALQTHELFGKINTFQWIVVSHLCGGENRKTEKNRLKKGVHILIATPGRLLDHILHTTALKMDNVRCLVLDEADRLLDMGFKKDIVKIVEELDNAKVNSEYNPMAMLKQLPKSNNEENNLDTGDLPPLKNISSKSRQTLLLSATLSKGVAELADFTMKEHIYIDALDESATVNPKHMVIPNTVKQEFIMTYVKHRLFTLSALLVAKCKLNSKVFVFMATSQMVDYHHELFTKYLVKMPINRGKLKSGDVVLLDELMDDSDDEEVVLDMQIFKLHGSMDQNIRKDVFTAFRAAKKGVLLCTDVAARGLDVPAADCIVQYTGPSSDEDYLHRVGRTGRAGKSGSAIIFLTHEEQDYISRLQEHKVFLTEHKADDFLKHLCDLMEESDHEKAATALQRRYEIALSKDKDLYKKACFAYSSWSRFYNTYPSKLRSIFNFKNVNLGHYVTSFGLKETPTSVAKIVRGQVVKTEPQRLNKKLATHEDKQPKRKVTSVSLRVSEFSSGLEPSKKKKRKKNDD